MSSLTLLFHLVVFGISAYSTYYDFIVIKLMPNKWDKFKFLTFWDIILQTVYFGICLLADITATEQGPGGVGRRTTVQQWRDSIHSTLAAPVAMFVASSFWILYAIDRELIFPKHLDEVFPNWLNQTLHTTIIVFIFIDKLLVYHHHPKKHVGISGSVGFASVYLAWILYLAFADNFWVYPILEVLQPHERAIFIGMCLLLFASLYILGDAITTFTWRKDINASRSKAKSQTKKVK